MRISVYDIKQWHKKLLPILGNRKFCSMDVKQYLGDKSMKKIGMILRLMWYHGLAQRHGRDKKLNTMIYSLRMVML